MRKTLLSLLLLFAGLESSVIFQVGYFNAFCYSSLNKEHADKKSFLKLKVYQENYEPFQTFLIMPKHLFRMSGNDCKALSGDDFADQPEPKDLDLKLNLLIKLGNEKVSLDFTFSSLFVDKDSIFEEDFFRTVFRSSIETVSSYQVLKECLLTNSYNISYPYESVYMLSTEIQVDITLIINCFSR